MGKHEHITFAPSILLGYGGMELFRYLSPKEQHIVWEQVMSFIDVAGKESYDEEDLPVPNGLSGQSLAAYRQMLNPTSEALRKYWLRVLLNRENNSKSHESVASPNGSPLGARWEPIGSPLGAQINNKTINQESESKNDMKSSKKASELTAAEASSHIKSKIDVEILTENMKDITKESEEWLKSELTRRGISKQALDEYFSNYDAVILKAAYLDLQKNGDSIRSFDKYLQKHGGKNEQQA